MLDLDVSKQPYQDQLDINHFQQTVSRQPVATIKFNFRLEIKVILVAEQDKYIYIFNYQ